MKKKSALILQIVLIFTLIAFYLKVAYLVFFPDVTDAYNKYYISKTTRDWPPLRYSAQLDDGIDFSKSGLPDFVVSSEGVSDYENWGRWTDAHLLSSARIVFNQNFIGAVCIHLKAVPTLKQNGELAYIRLGDQTKSFLTTNTITDYYINFFLPRVSNVVEIIPSAPGVSREWDKSNYDSRKIGLGLIFLKIKMSDCLMPSSNKEYSILVN